MFYTGKVKVPKDLDEAYIMAHEAKPELDRFGEDVAKMVGAEYKPADLKGKERARQKLESKYRGDISQLQDIARCKIICDSLEQMDEIKKYIRANANPAVEADRMERPNSRGYRDLKYTMPAGNGLLVEMQIHLRDFVEADKKTHKIYEKIRDITAGAVGRPLTEQEQLEILTREKMCKNVYAQAVKSYNKRTKGRKLRTLKPLDVPNKVVFEQLNQGKSM